MRLFFAILLWLQFGCEPPGSGAESTPPPDAEGDSGWEPIPLLKPSELTPAKPEKDPFASHRPRNVLCPSASWGPEGGAFEVQTGICNYGSFDQPLPVSVEPGDRLRILVWHDTLDFPEPALAHVGVWIGQTIIWEEELAIPAPSNSYELIVPVDTMPEPEARLGVHLHNHGYNSWRFVAVDLFRD